MDDLMPSAANCFIRIKKILAGARSTAIKRVNTAMLAAYWQIGREIIEEEQHGKLRANYGVTLLKKLSEKLMDEYGSGFSLTNMKLIRRFYLSYNEPSSQIGQTLSDQFEKKHKHLKIKNKQRKGNIETIKHPVRPELTWSHYCALMSITTQQARSFYEIECARSGWSVRELQRQINSLLFERLTCSLERDEILALARNGQVIQKPDDFIKDPYILEFVGLSESPHWLESDLENALISRLHDFLLELGRDLFFVARQKRITLDGDHFYIDLIFYHRILRCFLLIDLKLGKLSQKDIGQMLLYTGWFKAHEMKDGESPPVGLILCTDKNEAMVRYTLSETSSKVFASQYHLHLPSENELIDKLQEERWRIEEARNK